MSIVVLVHGFNVDDPERTVGGLATDLRYRGHEVHKFCYGHAGLLDVRVANPNLAHALLSQLRSIKRLTGKEIIPVGHSNGCALIHKAAELQQDAAEFLFTRCIYISPALDRKAELPGFISRCDVMFNKGDSAVSVSAWIPFHPWGDMGKKGYRGVDTRYNNCDCSDVVNGHSDWFKPEKRGFTVGKVDELLVLD
jgi:alpha-beta hydrolase superfamily lysophospholipase